jgi:hypothetical protein
MITMSLLELWWTIKAYQHSGDAYIYEATFVKIRARRDVIEYGDPNDSAFPDRCLLVGNETTDMFACVYIENLKGKTIECVQAPPLTVSQGVSNGVAGQPQSHF